MIDRETGEVYDFSERLALDLLMGNQRAHEITNPIPNELIALAIDTHAVLRVIPAA